MTGVRVRERATRSGGLRDLARRFGRLGVGVAFPGVILLVVTWYARAYGNAGLQLRVTTFLVGVVMAVGLQVFSGNTGIISFGQMAFVGAGAYVSALMTMPPVIKGLQGLHLPANILKNSSIGFLPALIIAVAVVGVVAALLAGPLLRLSSTSAVIGIFALLLIALVVFDNWQSLTNGAAGIYGVPGNTTLWSAFALALITITVGRWFRDSAVGLQLQASREDELAAAASGVRVRKLRAAAWVLGAMLSAVGGVLYAHELTAFSPTSFGLEPTFTVVVMVVIGGVMTVSGAVLGAGLVTIVTQGLLSFENKSVSLGFIHIGRLTGLSDLVLVILILLALYLRPEGLMGRKELDEHILARFRRKR